MAHCRRREPHVVQLTVLVRFLAAISPVSRLSLGVLANFRRTYPVAARRS